MYNLTDKQKDVLRWIVAQVQNGQIDEEFQVLWAEQGTILHSQGKANIDGIPAMTKTALLELDRAQVLSCQPSRLSMDCTLRQRAYDAVRTNFAEGSQQMTSPTEQYLQKVLVAIDQLQKKALSPATQIEDQAIAQETQLSLQDVQDYLELLENQNLIFLVRAGGPEYEASLTPLGRTRLRDPAFQTLASTSNVYHIHGGQGGMIINVGSILNDVTQTINQAPLLDQTAKAELTSLIDQLNTELQRAPVDHAEDAEAVAEQAKQLIEDVSKERPNKKRIAISIEGLKKATQDIGMLLPAIAKIADEIAQRIQNISF